jgi:hypothetical protein
MERFGGGENIGLGDDGYYCSYNSEELILDGAAKRSRLVVVGSGGESVDDNNSDNLNTYMILVV